MTPEELNTYTILQEELTRAKDYSQAGDFNSLFLGAETINAALAYLTDALIRYEQAYRLTILKFQEKGDSHAKAENKAKTLVEYQRYRKLSLIYERGEEQIKIIKKFRDVLGEEYKR